MISRQMQVKKQVKELKVQVRGTPADFFALICELFLICDVTFGRPAWGTAGFWGPKTTHRKKKTASNP